MNRTIVIAFSCVVAFSAAHAGIVPAWPESSVNLRLSLEKSAVVCKGEVIEAPTPKYTRGDLPRNTGMAVIRADRCFKGPGSSILRVTSDEYLPSGGFSGGLRLFVPKIGDYGLFFFKSAGPVYQPIDGGFPFVRSSRLLAADDSGGDPVLRLEADFLAGLRDPDQDLRLLTICWLGQLPTVTTRAVASLKEMLPASGELQRLYLWEALLSAGDYSTLPDAANDALDGAPIPRSFFLPRDRIPSMRYRVYLAICRISDPVVIPYMRKLAGSPDPNRRYDALQSLRNRHDLGSAHIFLKALSDHDKQGDTAFVAMQSLFELAGTGPGWDRIPQPEDFQAGDWAAEEVRDWWAASGEALAKRAAPRTAR
jgi:hypothetical protein